MVVCVRACVCSLYVLKINREVDLNRGRSATCHVIMLTMMQLALPWRYVAVITGAAA